MARKTPPPTARPRRAAKSRKGAAVNGNGKRPAEVEAETFPIVGIGGSAGGFEAMRALLGHLAPDTGMAFVIVMHLDPHAKSHAASLLGKITRMPVAEISGPTVVQPNHVYLAPPGRHLSIHARALTLSNPSGGEHLAVPIDRFFETLAAAEGYRAIGIVLSGTGSDGTLGLGRIKSEGGITFAQSERTAKQFGMPGSAIASGCVDAVLAPAAMARQLEDMARHPALYTGKPGTGTGAKRIRRRISPGSSISCGCKPAWISRSTNAPPCSAALPAGSCCTGCTICAIT